MGFLIYDVAFLVIFTLWVVWFLYTRKHNLTREGIIYLYRTQLGIRFINYIGKKFRKTLNVAQYFSVALGYVLMVGIIWVLGFSVYTYIKFPQITQIIKAPPILPLIPYFPKLFNLESFFPPLYFTYWILAILVVAVVHEFAHGFFAKFHGIKIKSTGFAFLGPILGAFVEPDEKQMSKKSIFAQLSILSGGVFANIITAVVFFLILWGLFGLAFQPGGVIIASYASGIVNIDDIESINGQEFNGEFLFGEDNLTKITAGRDYLISTENLKSQVEFTKSHEINKLRLFYDAPSINNEITGAISKVNGEEVKDIEDLSKTLSKYSPGDQISVETKISNDEINNYEIILGKNPHDETKPFLGINLNVNERKGIRGVLGSPLFFKDSAIYYEEKSPPIVFFYYLVWWIMLINFFVALFNMLPVGILDGGRFFYLTALAITRSEKRAKKVYKVMAYFILLIFIALIVGWLIAL